MNKVFVFCSLAVMPAMAAVSVPLTVTEAIYPGSTTGVARTNAPLTVGVPLPDSGGISSTAALGLTGATAAQFTIEETWPSGNIKWVKVRAIVPSVAAGGSTVLTLTGAGSGNFGGANLATDNGSTITVATGTATFTIKKANFNVVDQVVIGGTTVVAAGTSQGLVLTGPDPAAAYPGNVTCLPAAGGSACATAYSSANDPAATAVIEENGPAMAVIKATGSHVDGSGHAYMRFTTRLYFFKNTNSLKVTAVLRNADYGASNTFASAFKAYQAYEIRISPNLTGTLNYTIANDTATPTTGTVANSDSAYIYQAESNALKPGAQTWCAGYSGCTPTTSLSGYAIVKNGAAVLTGSASQFPQGWADIRDGSGVGVQIGQNQLAAYGNKSLEFLNGGKDVRIGLWARQNNTTGVTSTTSNAPYYMPWPQWDIQEAFLNFHATASASANDFLAYQHYLVARAPVAHYDSTQVFPYPLLDVTEENNYYSQMTSSATPAVSSVAPQDLGTTVYPSYLRVWKFYPWTLGGGSNQMEFHWSYLLNFIRRGYTGEYLDSASFYKMVSEKAFPMSDGFNWRSRTGETDSIGNPNPTSANIALGTRDWMDLEHAHGYGIMDYYAMSGDETVREAIIEGAKDRLMNTATVQNTGRVWNARAVGNYLMWDARLYLFLSSIGDSEAPTLLSQAQSVYNLQIKDDLCASGYPTGCTFSMTGADTTPYGRGTSRARGVPYQWASTMAQDGSCSAQTDRNAAPFQTSILLEGIWELRAVKGPSWPDYNQSFDLAYGMAKWALTETYYDDGTSQWANNGYRYYIALDLPNACDTVNYRVLSNQTVWFPFFITAKYEGSTSWNRKLQHVLQRDAGTSATDEFYQYSIAAAIHSYLHPTGQVLSTVPITNFVSNGGGSYTISWTVPSGASSYRIKWGSKQIVDWIGFDPGSNSFIGNPATTMNWFAATDAANIPSPSGTTQSLTISTGATGLTAGNFMIKAYIGGGVAPPPPPAGDTTPPTVSMTAPAAGATVSGTTSISATALDNIGVTAVQFKLDGVNLGAALATGPYSISWDTKAASNGTHVLSATAVDAAGNAAVSSTVSVTVANTTAPTGSGVLSGTVSTPTGTAMLAQQGTSDWAHWGLVAPTDFNHKAGVTQQISNVTLIGAASLLRYTNSSVGFTWTSGSPAASATNSATGVYVSGINKGFQITAPADTTVRTLNVYVGLYNSQCRMTAQLSDGSAPNYVDTTLQGTGLQAGVYTFTYSAASAGQQLTVKYTQDSASGNVALQAATLAAGATAPPATPDFTVAAPSSSQTAVAGSSAAYAVDVAAQNGFAGSVAFNVTGLPAGVTAAFNPSTVTGSGSSTMTLTTGASSAAGTYTLTITAASGSLSHTAAAALSVTAPAPPSGGGTGTALPLKNWTSIAAHGFPGQIYGYDKSVYVNSRKLHCVWGGYHQTISSEPQDATVCYSYLENRWFIMQNNGLWHSDHLPSAGHSTGLWAYMPDRDVIVGATDGSGSNTPDKFLGHWWWFDVGGLSGQEKEFTPRPWLGVTTPTSAMTYDPLNLKLVIFPDLNGGVTVCDPASNSCTAPKTTGTAPPNMGDLSLVYNTANRKIYLYGGGQGDLYTFDVSTNVWTRLATTCVGADCVSGKPPARMAAGFAYSTVDNVFLMAGGTVGFTTAFNDTWIFDPSTLVWTEQSTTTKYSNSAVSPTFDRLTYDPDSNVFVMMSTGGSNFADGSFGSYPAQIWAYAYSPAQNYGRTSNTYTPPAGSLNRVSPTASSQSWAFDPAITSAGSLIYAGWIETGAPFDSSNCGGHHPYIQSASSIATWTGLPGGTQAAACKAIDPEPSSSPGNSDDSKLRLAVVNGKIWEAHEKWNLAGLYSSTWAKVWDGTSWTGGAVGCFSGACSGTLVQYPQALIASGATPTLAVVENNNANFVADGRLMVAQWNGSSWAALGGILNIVGTGSRALFATLASDGTYPAACWSEEVNSNRSIVSTTPQIQCAKWNGSSWARFGNSSLNQSASSWAYSPSMTYAGGKFYIGWTERTTSGNNKLYVCRWDGSSCTLLGGGPLNLNQATGWAVHPSLATDGTNVFVAWEEQSALGQHSMGYVKKWNGTSWAQVGGILNADAVNGSIEGITLTVAQGVPTAIWGEMTYGSLRQVYVKQWDGANWTGPSGTSAPPPTMTCDLNGDGKVDQADITIATNQALGIAPCTNADLQQTGNCSVVGVQRVINASLGAACRIGN